jgi:hypothetical protein
MFLFPHYSRVQESEADRVGLFYMAKAGYDPRAAVEIWRRAAEAEGGEGAGLGGFLSSHPQNKDRMVALQQNLPQALEFYERATGNIPTTAAPEPAGDNIVTAVPMEEGRTRAAPAPGAYGSATGTRSAVEDPPVSGPKPANGVFRARPIAPNSESAP